MFEVFFVVATLGSIVLVIYHHVLYPLILRSIHRRRPDLPVAVQARHYAAESNDDELPSVSVIVPAYNEAAWIAAKIQNLAILDYPSDRLKITLACDGCTDATARIARECAALPECAHLAIEIIEFEVNRGKVAVINDVVRHADTDLVALSDVSALVSVDALLVAAARFSDPDIGVVNSRYQILSPGSTGEDSYWRYQSRIKSSEAALGATLGAHGAFYLFRRHLFRALPDDTINDDFVLPMQIVAQGYRGAHEERILALELEQANDSMDRHRRMRISAGNLQQVLRLKHLLLPRYRGVAFAFMSGKALRVAMPVLMIQAFLGSIVLASEGLFFLVAAVGQTLLYGTAAWEIARRPRRSPRLAETLGYIMSGHAAGLLGSLQYLFRPTRKAWKRVTEQTTPSP